MAKEVYIKTYKTDKVYSNALTFDGTDDFITIVANSVFNFTAPSFTLEAWIYPTNLTGRRVIFGKLPNTGANGYSFATNGSNLELTLHGVASLTGTTAPLILNTWQHICLVFDSSQDLKIYFNGTLVETRAGASNPLTSTASQSIGRAGEASTEYFKGYIQDLRIWNDERTQTEIQNNAFGLLTDTTNLVAWYKLNEGTGTTATDSKGSYTGTLTNFPASPWQQQYIAPVYARTYKGFSVDYSFSNISSQINSGFGSLNFTIPRQFDVLNSQDPQNLKGYELDVIAYDNQESTGITLFSGDVSIIDRSLSGDSESVQYTATSPLERLEKIDVEDTDSIVSYSSTEIATIFRDLINKCNFKAKKQILKYTDTSIATTSKTISTTFSNAFVGDALKYVFSHTTDGWIWYIDTDRTVYLKQISSTPDHYFYNGKDITEIQRSTDKTKVINVLKLWDGDNPATVLRKYYQQGSIDDYGYSAKAIRDGRFTTTAGALEFATREIANTWQPNDQITLTIIDSSGGGYNIDDIKVGDTFKILNLNVETALGNLLVVTSKTDYLDYCTITASDRETYVFRELTDLKKTQFQVNNENHPTTAYTEVAL